MAESCLQPPDWPLEGFCAYFIGSTQSQSSGPLESLLHHVGDGYTQYVLLMKVQFTNSSKYKHLRSHQLVLSAWQDNGEHTRTPPPNVIWSIMWQNERLSDSYHEIISQRSYLAVVAEDWLFNSISAWLETHSLTPSTLKGESQKCHVSINDVSRAGEPSTGQLCMCAITFELCSAGVDVHPLLTLSTAH